MAVLRVRKGKQPGAVFPVFSSRQPTTLGREGQVDISLLDPRASRRHAQISLRRGRWLLEDLGSSNGTLVGGEKVTTTALKDGDTVRIGGTFLTFHAPEPPPAPAFEIHGAQPRETLWEECGVLVLGAHQSAMDRAIRVDWLHPSRELSAGALERLEGALVEGEELRGEGFLGLIGGKAALPPADGGEDGKPWQGTYVLLRGPCVASLASQWEQVLRLPLEHRLEILRALAELYLERSARTRLRGPLSLERIGARLEPGQPPRLFLPAVDLGLILAEETGQLLELRSYVDYLPPEYQGEDGSSSLARLPGGLQVAMYSLGALGYHLVARQKAMGDGEPGDVLRNHRQVQPAPAALVESETPPALSALIERLLAKDPAQRPADATEVLRALPEARAPAPSITEPAPAPAAPSAPARPRGRPAAAPVRSLAPAPTISAPTAAPVVRADRGLARSAAVAKAPPSALEKVAYLPLWALLWIALFFAAKYLARLVFRELGGG